MCVKQRIFFTFDILTRCSYSTNARRPNSFLTEVVYTAVRLFPWRDMAFFTTYVERGEDLALRKVGVRHTSFFLRSRFVKCKHLTCSLLQLPTRHKTGLCVACTVRVWETNGVSSLRSSDVKHFLSSAVSAPLMEVENVDVWVWPSLLLRTKHRSSTGI